MLCTETCNLHVQMYTPCLYEMSQHHGVTQKCQMSLCPEMWGKLCKEWTYWQTWLTTNYSVEIHKGQTNLKEWHQFSQAKVKSLFFCIYYEILKPALCHQVWERHGWRMNFIQSFPALSIFRYPAFIMETDAYSCGPSLSNRIDQSFNMHITKKRVLNHINGWVRGRSDRLG